MKKVLLICSIAIVLGSCMNGQTQKGTTSLAPSAFFDSIKQHPSAIIIDVRTPEEFANGHLQQALNYNWSDNSFKEQAVSFDKTKPIYIYCLSGGRSASAASYLRRNGFNEVYEMDGGMIKWRAENLPETNANNSTWQGKTKQEFEALLESDTFILVDFYADWCAPCKKMKPSLDAISVEMANKVTIIRLNADEHPSLCMELNVDALPTLKLYKNKSLIWTHSGYIEKEDIVKQLN